MAAQPAARAGQSVWPVYANTPAAPEYDPDTMRAAKTWFGKGSEFLGSSAGQLVERTQQAELALVGRSNAGKSTLLNTLVRQDVSRVSKRPGMTHDLDMFSLGPPASGKVLVDLPGFGYAARTGKPERDAWMQIISSYLAGRASSGQLRRALLLLDVRYV